MTDDEATFSALYRQHYSYVRAYARRRFSVAADDVVADVFTVAWRKLEDYEAGGLPWLYAVAARVGAANRRSDARAKFGMLHLALVDLSTAADDVAVEREVMQRALSRLSSDDREALMLIGWESLTNEEAAQVLGCSTSTLAVRLHRARKRLELAIGIETHNPQHNEDITLEQAGTLT